jgi:hypothetical protein
MSSLYATNKNDNDDVNSATNIKHIGVKYYENDYDKLEKNKIKHIKKNNRTDKNNRIKNNNKKKRKIIRKIKLTKKRKTLCC